MRALDSRRTIALVSYSPLLGGAERMLLNLAIALAASKLYQPVVFVPSPRDGELSDRLDDHGIRWVAIPAITSHLGLRKHDAKFYAAAVAEQAPPLGELLIRSGASLVVVNTLTNLTVPVAAYLANLPSILWVHGVLDTAQGLIGDEFSAAMEQIAFSLSSRVVACSEWTASHYQAAAGDKLQTIPNWTDIGSDPPVLRSDRFAVVSTLVPYKSVETVIRGAAILRGQGVFCGLDIYAEGRDRRSLEQLASALNVADRVQFHGRVSDVASVYQRAAAIIVPSVIESFGMVAIEAMAQRTPVLLARTGGLAAIGEDRVSALYFQPGDAADLAKAIAVFLNETDRVALGNQGYQRVQALFSPAVALARFEDLFADAIEAASPYSEQQHRAADTVFIMSNCEPSAPSSGDAELRAEVDRIRSSLSWRVTRPLRSISARFPHLRAMARIVINRLRTALRG